jgi:hypothetical protein
MPGQIRSTQETLDHFLNIKSSFLPLLHTLLIILIITTLQIRIIRVQVVIKAVLSTTLRPVDGGLGRTDSAADPMIVVKHVSPCAGIIITLHL